LSSNNTEVTDLDMNAAVTNYRRAVVTQIVQYVPGYCNSVCLLSFLKI